MPSMDNPTYYERSQGIAPGRTDAFFKSLDLDDTIDDCGSVEMPLGFVTLVKVTRDMISEYVTREGDPWLSERRNFAPGWYVTRTDDNGLIWAMSYGGFCDEHNTFCTDTHAEELARADFNEALRVWIEWSDEELYDET